MERIGVSRGDFYGKYLLEKGCHFHNEVEK